MKRYFLLLLIVLISNFNFSQSKFEFNHSLGGTIAVYTKYNYFNINLLMQYNPKVSYCFTKNTSISISSFPSINPIKLAYRDPFFILPIGFQINAGNCASKESTSTAGFYFNAGVCDFALGDEYLEIKPFFSAGVKIDIITLKMDFIPVLNENKATNIINFGLLVNLNKKE